MRDLTKDVEMQAWDGNLRRRSESNGSLKIKIKIFWEDEMCQSVVCY